MTRLLALLCGFLFVLCCILVGLLFKRGDAESGNNVNVNTHVFRNTPTLDSANVQVHRDSAGAARVDIEIQGIPEESPPPRSGSAEDAAGRALRDAQREAQDRRIRQKQENLDALSMTGVSIASDAQAWSLKPAAFGGPTEDESIADVQFTDMGYANVNDGVFPTIDGQFWLEADNGALVVVGENRTWQNRIVVTVTGSAPSDLHMRVAPE